MKNIYKKVYRLINIIVWEYVYVPVDKYSHN